MDEHIRTLRKEELLVEHKGWFDEENAERIASWLVAAEDRTPVVLVGAGFSLNARDRQTGKPATKRQAPLWTDLIPPLASDLGVEAAQYDAPTLFELYEEALSKAKLRDTLLNAVADADLEPGEAHKALAVYPCEAIVTTNCLDTLLDRACSVGWRRVVQDAQLSASGRERDLIYLHGHRDFSDSWVMTRSQYEDFARTKPVMVARVRQLLAQHPWLIVGFGMTDPNFHSVARVLGAEMRGHQPLSLSLMTSQPTAAERQHWRRLGFEMVAPKLDGRDFGDFLAWAFPKLATHYSPTSEAAKSYIQRATSLEERLRRFRTVNPTPIVDRDAAYQAWEGQLVDLLTADERASAEDAAQAAAHANLGGRVQVPKEAGGAPLSYTFVAPVPLVPPLRSPVLRELDHENGFHSLASVKSVQILDRLLQKDQKLRAELAEHFGWGLEHRLFVSAFPRALWELVAIHLAKDAGWRTERIQQLIQHATSLARTYEDAHVEALLGRQVRLLGFELPPVEQGSNEQHLTEAKTAYQAFMNSEFTAAAKCYERAAQLASAAGLGLETWAYTRGQADAIDRSIDPIFEPPSIAISEQGREHGRLQVATLRDQVRRLVSQPVVEHWRKQADQRSLRALQEENEGYRKRERYRMTGGSGMRWSGTARALWQTYRELHIIHAPPSLQRRYAEPLLPWLDADTVHLVIANASKPHEWLASLLERAPRTLTERNERDRKLVEALLPEGKSPSRRERLASLRCIRELTTVLRVDDVPRALKWLEDAVTHIRRDGRASAESQNVADDCWLAFGAIARWAEPHVALRTARFLVEGLGTVTADGALRALYDLPWHEWKLTECETAKGFLELLTQLVPADGSAGARRRGTSLSYALFALVRMVEAGMTSSALRPQHAVWKRLLDDVRSLSHELVRYSEAKRAGFLLEREFARLDSAGKRDTSDALGAWFDTPGGSDDKPDDQELWTTLLDVLPGTNLYGGLLVERLGTEVERLVSDEKAIGHYELNPHSGESAARLLVRGLQCLGGEKLPTIADFLVRLVEVAPNLIAVTHGAMRRQLWQNDSWNRLTSVVVAACGGTRSVGSGRADAGLAARCQSAVLTLFGTLDPCFRSEEPTLWCTLQGLALASVNDERSIVANRAAFSVVNAARHVTEASDAALYGSALRRITNDARVEVRSAVAYAGHTLVKHACTEIKGAAEEALGLVKSDDNAQIQWLLAAAERA